MFSTRRQFLMYLTAAGSLVVASRAVAHDGHHGASTPESMPAGCGPMGTPAMGDHGHHDTSTPMAMMDGVDFDLLYIDMMIPHHESVIALAEAAMGDLEDERLQLIAQAILDTQQLEIEELADLREEWYGDREPAMMDHDMMAMSMGMQSDCVDQAMMDEMMNQMDSEWHVSTFEAADDKDLAFIEQVIPHHEMAIVTSRLALEYGTREELRDIAQLVIEAQEREISELEEIRSDLTGEATPAA